MKKEPSARVKTRGGQFLWAIKSGSGLAINRNGINLDFLANVARQANCLRERGLQIVLVGSGARACGEYYYQGDIYLGQKRLFKEWGQAFGRYGIEVAEHLVMDWDLIGRGSERFRRKLLNDLEKGAISLINGNDYYIREKDRATNNDYVVYRVAKIMGAKTLINMTNVDGVMDTRGEVVRIIRSKKDLDNVQFNGHSELGRGGMELKYKHTNRFAKLGIAYICNGNDENILLKISEGQLIGTRIQL